MMSNVVGDSVVSHIGVLVRNVGSVFFGHYVGR